MDAILNSLVKGVTSLKEDHGRTFAHVVSECIRKDRLRGIYEYQLSFDRQIKSWFLKYTNQDFNIFFLGLIVTMRGLG